MKRGRYGGRRGRRRREGEVFRKDRIDLFVGTGKRGERAGRKIGKGERKREEGEEERK